MKIALLLPGYLDSPDYLHFKVIESMLKKNHYTVNRIDPCDLWKTGDVNNYNLTNYLKSIKNTINLYKNKKPQEIIVIGHSFGGSVAFIAGSKFREITKVIGLCPAVSFTKSDKKWNDSGIRFSKRDLPQNPLKFKEFNIPISFVKDRKKYSIPNSLKKINKPLMVLIGMKDDTVLSKDVIKAMKNTINHYMVKMKNMGHNFRNSEKEASLVADEIEKFLIR